MTAKKKLEDENFYAERAIWLDYLNERRDITHGEFRVAYFIASKINPIDKCMWWGVDSIADELGVSCATVSKATDALSHRGLLVVSTRKVGARRVKQYALRMPADPAHDKWLAEPPRRTKSGGRAMRVSKTETNSVSKTETKYNKGLT